MALSCRFRKALRVRPALSDDEIMDLICRADILPARLAVFPGTFNPPTRAHLALAEAALREVDEVLFVLPRSFPHKPYEGASFPERIRLLTEALASHRRFSLAASEGGLFIDIARECLAHYPGGTDLLFLCGRDAAERVVNWDYGDADALRRMLDEFGLLVARRRGDYNPPPELRPRIHFLTVGSDWDEVSASAVRQRIAAGEPWRHLVPDKISGLVEEIYSR